MPSNFKALAGASGGEPTDANFKNVTLLLHGDGSNGAQNNTFLDSSTNNFTITRVGNPTQGSVNPYGANWSNYFDGSGDYLTLPSGSGFAFGTGDFTVECWVFSSNAASTSYVIVDARNSGQTGTWVLFRNINNQIEWFNGSSSYTTTTNIPANQWNHIAYCRSGTTGRVLLNGSVVGTFTDSTNYSVSPTTSYIGCRYSVNEFFSGYISNFRTVKGTALYTGSYTVPTAPLTAITNTSLLTCAYNRFRDASTNNFTITRNGDVKVTNFAPFAPSSAYSTTTNGGSAYFDGTGDYISAPYSVANSEWWTQDFTMEMWVYNNTNAVSGSDNVCLQLAHGIPTTADAYWVFGTNASGQVEFLYYNGSVVRLTGTTAAALTAWNHIAMVYTNSTGNISLYLNGSRVATGTKSGTPQKSSGSTINVGVAQNTYYNGYISNLRILDGTALYSGTTYTVPTTPATAITNTSLLLNATNAAIFDNSMKNDLETVGNAQISTSVKKFGTGSMAFDGTGDWLQLPSTSELSFGTGNFTIEMWMYAQNLASIPMLFHKGSSGSNGWFCQTSASTLYFGQLDSARYSTWSVSLSNNTWYHIALTRVGSTLNVFINGVSQTAQTVSGADTSNDNTSPALIGVIAGGTYALQGYLDDYRITKGVARYTANFTPPTAAFPNK